MKNYLKTTGLFFSLLCLSGAAGAVEITDKYYVDPNDHSSVVYLSLAQDALHHEYSFTHSLLDDGFNPGVDTINQATLYLDVFDDNQDINGAPETSGEFFRLNLDANSLQVFEVDFSAISVSVSTSLLSDGRLDVLLRLFRPQGQTGVSDFFFRSSTLVADVTKGAVPAPLTFLLVGAMLPLIMLRRYIV